MDEDPEEVYFIIMSRRKCFESIYSSLLSPQEQPEEDEEDDDEDDKAAKACCATFKKNADKAGKTGWDDVYESGDDEDADLEDVRFWKTVILIDR